MKLPQLTLRELFWLVLVVAIALGWGLSAQRAAEERRKLVAENEALRRASAWHVTNALRGGMWTQPELVNTCKTPEDFVKALREVKDWYEFNDEIADAFVKTPVADEAVPALIELLQDSSTEVRTRAASTLGKIKRQPEVIVPALIPVLEDREPNVQWHAAFALRQFGPQAKTAIPALLKEIETAPPTVAINSIEAVNEIDPTVDTEPRLLPFLQSEDEDLRYRAVSALRASGSSAGKAALVELFERETKANVKDMIALTIATIDARLLQQDGADAALPD